MDEEFPFKRYVQFGFEENRFLMDLPLGTLFKDEADEISARRSGFSWASQNGNPAVSEKDGEERTAAEDAAFILFEVWGLPAKSRLFVSASSCHTPHSWERGEPFEWRAARPAASRARRLRQLLSISAKNKKRLAESERREAR